MIAGIIIRGFKNYKNLKFVPIANDENFKYSVFVGNNGVGKSAVLEAIDTIINNKEWNITIGGKKSEAFICLIFLIDKKEEIFLKNNKEIFDFISDYFWNSNEDINSNLKSDTFKKFFNFRDELKLKYEKTHNFILLGVNFEDKNVYFSTFNHDLTEKIKEHFDYTEETLQKKLIELKEALFNSYNYLYIPVEQSIDEFMKLESEKMQLMLNKDLLDEIEKILKEKYIIEELNPKGVSIVELINRHLDKFIREINEKISQIDNTYSFENLQNFGKKSLTPKDIRTKILEAYFPLRVLKRNGKRVNQLSSGEQRKALLDIAYSILSTNGEKATEKKTILAIDEPEVSMHISNCFKQFQMLEELSTLYNQQIILTTHWYGFLPITQQGNMQHININTEDKDNINISTFNFYNYLEERKYYPDIIELKSMFDLAASILTYMRNNSDVNWIICEGITDKIYLEQILNEEINVNILPVGGCGNVVKLFQLLCLSMIEKTDISIIQSKALFLIDTDSQNILNNPLIDIKNGNKSNFFFKRLQKKENEIHLVNPFTNGIYDETEIEDCLNPENYFEAVKNSINKSTENNLKDIIKHFELIQNPKTSKLKGDDSCIMPNDVNFISNKKEIINFVTKPQNKYLIAKEYVELCKRKNTTHSIKIKIIDLFKK